MYITVMLSDTQEDCQVHNLHIEMELEDLKNLRDQLAYIFPFLEQEGSFNLLDQERMHTDNEIFRSDVAKRSLWRSIAGLYYHLKGY